MVIYSMQRDFHAEAWEMFLLIIYLKCMQYFTIKKKKKNPKKEDYIFLQAMEKKNIKRKMGNR